MTFHDLYRLGPLAFSAFRFPLSSFHLHLPPHAYFDASLEDFQ